MAFLETPRFPEQLNYGFSGGPLDYTDIAASQVAKENRNLRAAVPLSAYDCDTADKSDAQTKVLLAYWRVTRGRWRGFRFKDWNDYTAAAAEGVTALVSGSIYQLNKRYDLGGGEFIDRKITKPVAGTLVITRTRAAVPTVITPTIDTTTGQITVTGHVGGDTYTWTGEFDVPCRFDADRLNIVAAGPGRSMWGSVPIKEIAL